MFGIRKLLRENSADSAAALDELVTRQRVALRDDADHIFTAADNMAAQNVAMLTDSLDRWSSAMRVFTLVVAAAVLVNAVSMLMADDE